MQTVHCVPTHSGEEISAAARVILRRKSSAFLTTVLFDDLMVTHPEISLLTEQFVPVKQPINHARNIVQDLLVANPMPGSITATWCGWDETAIGVTQVCEEAGRDEICIVGVGGKNQALSLIKAGNNLKITFAQDFEGMEIL